jgi:hypothetical protein
MKVLWHCVDGVVCPLEMEGMEKKVLGPTMTNNIFKCFGPCHSIIVVNLLRLKRGVKSSFLCHLGNDLMITLRFLLR